MPDSRSWLAPAAAIVGAVTALRVVLLAFSQADLFVDEAQYWLWGQSFEFGYYSKPPLIAWVIGATTGLAGSDAPFFVRLPAPLFHAATALILGAIAARLYSARAAVLVAAAYATLPMVAVGSLLISTDTIMFPFLALALAIYLVLIEPGGDGRARLAAAVGICLGVAFLAKYAAAYYLLFGALAALHPRLRPGLSDALVIFASFALVAAPNIAWNLANGLSTMSHTIDNTGWRGGLTPDPGAMLRFLGEQFLVFGPVLFVALVAAVSQRGTAPPRKLFLALSLPIIALVAGQALISGANANWAVAAYLAGTLIAVPYLMGRWRGWLILSFALGGAVSLALPLAATRAETLRLGDRLLLSRYVGLDELSLNLLAEAEARGATAIVADDRAVLADLFHTGRDSAIPVYARPPDGAPRNHYEQRYPYAGDAQGPVLAVTRGAARPPCAATPAATLTPGPGAYDGATIQLWMVPPDCWSAR